jgi:hypothetical protein
VGFSYGGFLLAQALWDHLTITVIDKRDHFESLTSSFKALFEPELLDDCLNLNQRTADAYKKINYKRGMLTKVSRSKSAIEVSNFENGLTE